MLGWIGAVVQGAKDFHDDVKTGVTTQWQYTNEKKNTTRAYRRQRALYMLDYDLHKPSAQMALLKQANLNPNLVYGEHNAGSVVSHMPTVPQDAPFRVHESHSGSKTPFGAYLEGKLADEQIKNAKEQNNVLKATVKELEARTREADSRTALNKLNAGDIEEHGSPGTASGSAQAVGLTKRLIERGQEIGRGVADYISNLQAEAYGKLQERKRQHRRLYDYSRQIDSRSWMDRWNDNPPTRWNNTPYGTSRRWPGFGGY